MSEHTSAEGPSDMKAGEKPRDSISELLHGEQNNGITEEEDSRRDQAQQEATQETARIRSLPGDHDRGHL